MASHQQPVVVMQSPCLLPNVRKGAVAARPAPGEIMLLAVRHFRELHELMPVKKRQDYMQPQHWHPPKQPNQHLR